MTAFEPKKNGNGFYIQAAIFDLDGVLMDTEKISFQVWRCLAKEYGGTLQEEHFPVMTGLTAEETGEYVMRVSGARFELASTVDRAWRGVLDEIEAGLRPLPGAVELLQKLASHGIPLAIASNSPSAYIRTSLEGLGLAKYFRCTVGVDQVEQGKPAPDVYLRAAALLNADPSRCLAVEDSLVGSQAAFRAGMRVLAVPSHHDQLERFAHCYKVYDSLADVVEELDQLLRD